MRTFLQIILVLVVLASIVNGFGSGNIVAASVSILTIAVVTCTMTIKYVIEDNTEYLATAIRKVKEALNNENA